MYLFIVRSVSNCSCIDVVLLKLLGVDEGPVILFYDETTYMVSIKIIAYMSLFGLPGLNNGIIPIISLYLKMQE